MMRFCTSGTSRRADLDAEVAARDHDRVRGPQDRREVVERLRLLDLRDHLRRRARLVQELAELRARRSPSGRTRARRSRPRARARTRDRARSFSVSDGTGTGTPGTFTPLWPCHDTADHDRRADAGPPRRARRAGGRGRRRSARRGRGAAPREHGRRDGEIAVSVAVLGADDHDLVARVERARLGSRSPSRSFGPWRSAISASGRPARSWPRADERARRRVLVVRAVGEVEPRRVHPGRDERGRRPRRGRAGPIVQTIFVRRRPGGRGRVG